MGFDAPDIVWSQCQSTLQSELPEQQYNTWIRPLKIKYFQEDQGGRRRLTTLDRSSLGGLRDHL